MKIDKQITDFIQMRIEGKSFDEIAKQMAIAKSTLIDWNKKATIRDAINQEKIFAINEVVRVFQQDRKERLKVLLQLSKKINDELLNRDMADVPTDKLLQMSIANEIRVLKMIDKSTQIGNSYMDIDMGDGHFHFKLDE